MPPHNSDNWLHRPCRFPPIHFAFRPGFHPEGCREEHHDRSVNTGTLRLSWCLQKRQPSGDCSRVKNQRVNPKMSTCLRLRVLLSPLPFGYATSQTPGPLTAPGIRKKPNHFFRSLNLDIHTYNGAKYLSPLAKKYVLQMQYIFHTLLCPFRDPLLPFRF